MKCLFSFLLITSLLLTGCSGSSSSSPDLPPIPFVPVNSTAIETCYDVKVTYDDVNKTTNICTTKENGLGNGLGVNRFLRFTLTLASSVTITATRTTGLSPSDPDLYIVSKGQFKAFADSTRDNQEFISTSLVAGDYVVALEEYGYFDSNSKLSLKSVLDQQKTNSPATEFQAISNCPIGGATVTHSVSGRITFDRVTHTGSALNYTTGIVVEPAQGVAVQVICNGGEYGDIVTTDSNGNYTGLVYPDGFDSFIRVKAQLIKTDFPTWNFSVVDNTVSTKPVYALDGAVFVNQTIDQTIDLHAASGWGGSSYTTTRASAPFAIIDSVRKAKDKVLTVSNVSFPLLLINWSPSNTIDSIGSSHYNGEEIFILGAENSDTDEFDEHVIIHEWGHYFEDKFSRSDSIGGPHGVGDILDMRVAFGEGFGNAFSAMVTDDPLYIDSSGFRQGFGFSINMEDNSCANSGWYSECSVQSVLYDFYDSANDDALAMGFSPIYNVLTTSQRNTEAFTSIFSFIKYFKDENAINAAQINILTAAQDIDVITDIYGDSELTNNPGATNQIPVYGQY